jgi:hypothetical protein
MIRVSDVPMTPIVVSDPRASAMGYSLQRYVSTRVHEVVDTVGVRRIVVVGSHDRTHAISRKEKRDKLENWQRPTAEVSAGEVRIHCFPGMAHVFHHASLIATHLALTGRDPSIVQMELPSEGAAWDEIQRSSLADLRATSVVVVAADNQYLEPMNPTWEDRQSHVSRTERIGDKEVTWLGVKHSFWGDIAYHLGRHLVAKGFKTVVFVGKLGSLRVRDVPNATIATGTESDVGGVGLSWPSIFGEGGDDIQVGRHITVQSVLEESVLWRDRVQGHFDFVDPEVGPFAARVTCSEGGFGYLHIVSDNVSAKYGEDLANERDGLVREKREVLYGRIGRIVRETIERL